MTYEYHRDEITPEQMEEMKAFARDNICAECQGELQVHTVPESATIRVGCLNRDHHGWLQRETMTQALRRGELVPPGVEAAVGKHMMPREDLDRAMNLLAVRYPRAIVDTPTAALFVHDCSRLGLDPLISPAEAVPIPFRRKDKNGKVIGVAVTMIITEDGWLSMAARGCPDRWAGAPAIQPVRDKDLAESLCGDKEAWLFEAIGRTKDMEPGQTSNTYGWFKKVEYEEAKANRTPAADQPGNQARIRAIKRWVRENFPECRQNMMDITAEWRQRAEGIQAAQDYIDAEYDILISTESPEASPSPAGNTTRKGDEKLGARPKGRGKKEPGGGGASNSSSHVKTADTDFAAESVAPAPVPDYSSDPPAFNIDMAWLSDNLKAISWSEDTATSWLAGHYKVDATGTLEGVIKKLTRAQAEEFLKEVQERSDKKQRQLFE